MARDAIARLYDVDANAVKLTPTAELKKGGYQLGVISFAAKKNKSIDLNQIHESITATRLSGGTNMGVDYLEITARGEVIKADNKLLLKVSDTGQEFVLSEDPTRKDALPRLRDSLDGRLKIIRVTGRVAGWNGRFPDVLKALAGAGSQPQTLAVTDFELP